MGTVFMSFAMSLRVVVFLLLVCAWRASCADTLLVLGDSLSAGYGLPTGSSWVSLLETRLADGEKAVTVVNASISGETTAGGKRRIQRLLDRHEPHVVVIELGANDGLRGIRIPLIRDNLSAIVDACQRHGAKTLIVGMRIPPNYGRDYGEKFHALFREVSDSYGTSLVPFMLDGFADDWALFQDDGIHPNSDAQPLIMETIYGQLKPLL
jgi:acyl-CoA thioesterase-1